SFGDPDVSTVACDQPSGYVSDSTDCDDGEVAVNPDVLEDCTDSTDNNCNDEIDEACEYLSSSADLTIMGASSNDHSGVSFTAADINGDSYDDLIIGAYAAESYKGRSSVFFGPLTAGNLTMESDESITFVGGSSSSYSGWTVEAGDLDGDGYDDMLIAGYYDSYVTSFAGSVYIIYGPQTGALSASDADAVIHGKSSYDYLGYYQLAAYDIDGDGDDEAMIGAYGYDSSNTSAGAIGIFDAPTGNVQIDSGDYLLTGQDAYDYVGYSSGDIGDINNDGFADIGWGEPGDSVVYLMLGPVSSGTYDSDDADVIIQGATSSSSSSGGNYAGTDMTGGDFNGDGYADTVVGAMYDYITSTYQGSIALFYGPLSGTVSYGTDSNFRFYDPNTYNYVGSAYYGSVTVGDIDEDGNDDLLITNMYNEDVNAYGGAAFILYGPMSGDTPTTDHDVAIYGDASAYLGRHASALADLDGNGSLDVVVGSYTASSYTGETYVFFDGQF
ncbi:MAG: hypothetical protein CL927_05870, partial [Deltaproteobacteria bacterium]|nr:hypothetical protein [Deltaproteobacteria bacterium]